MGILGRGDVGESPGKGPPAPGREAGMGSRCPGAMCTVWGLHGVTADGLSHALRPLQG